MHQQLDLNSHICIVGEDHANVICHTPAKIYIAYQIIYLHICILAEFRRCFYASTLVDAVLLMYLLNYNFHDQEGLDNNDFHQLDTNP